MTISRSGAWDPERLLLEDQASNTAENFALSKPLLYEAGVDVARDTVAVVTNDFHIARSELIAAREGYGDTAGHPGVSALGASGDQLLSAGGIRPRKDLSV